MSKAPPNQHIPKEWMIHDKILVEAASRFGTPLYLYDTALMKQRWDKLCAILPRNTTVFYSVKANPNVWIIDVFRKLGASCEVASSGEIVAALRAGVAPSDIIFVGPGKSRHELEYAVTCNLAAIAAESKREIRCIAALSELHNRKVRIALRINPGRGKGSISMGGATQFGMEPEVALGVLEGIDDFTNLEIVGLHAYLGTGILAWQEVLEHTQMILEIADQLQQQSGREFSFIDVGGGFGIPYYHRDNAPDWNVLSVPLADLVEEYLQKHPWTETLAVESGRFLAGPAGVFLTSVLDVKSLQDKWFVILDGGINVFGGEDHYRGFRPTPVRVLGNEGGSKEPITLCGPLCTSADRLAVDTLLPMPRIGDLVAFYQAGAYRFTASPGLFLSHGFPCEVLAHEGQLSLIRERMTPERFLIDQPRSLEAE